MQQTTRKTNFASATDIAGPWIKTGDGPELSACPSWCGTWTAEGELTRIDGTTYLFFTAYNAQEKPTAIGMARSVDDLDFDVYPTPVVDASQTDALYVVAPTALVAGNTLYVWYTRIGTDDIGRIGLLTAELH